MNKFTHTSITLSEQERLIVRGLMAGIGQTFSGALRFIINDWYKIQKESPDASRQTTDKPVRTDVLSGT